MHIKRLNLLLFIYLFVLNLYKSPVCFSQSTNDQNIENEAPLFDFVHPDSLDSAIIAFSEGETIFENNYRNSNSSIDLFSKAASHFNLAINRGLKKPEIYFKLGVCQYYEDKYIDAVKSFGEAIRLQKPGVLQFELINSYMKVGEKYVNIISQTLNFNIAFAYYFRAECKLNLKDYRGAISDYSTLLQMTEDFNNVVFSKRGKAKFFLKLYKEAIDDFTFDIELKKTDVNKGISYYNRGLCHFYLESKEASCRDMSIAGELGYDAAYDFISKECQ